MHSELWEVLFIAYCSMVVFQPFLLKTSNHCKIHKCNGSRMRHITTQAPYWGLIYTTSRAQALFPVFRSHLIHSPSWWFQEFSPMLSLRFSLHSIIQMGHSCQNQYQIFREVLGKRRQLQKSFGTHTSPSKPLFWFIKVVSVRHFTRNQ